MQAASGQCLIQGEKVVASTHGVVRAAMDAVDKQRRPCSRQAMAKAVQVAAVGGVGKG